MLSGHELRDGMTFILQLWDSSGVAAQWVETLRGETASRWYDIYQRSDWEGLRAEAADIFHRRVTDSEAQAVRSARHRCVFIHTLAVKADELAAGRGST
jgi:DNA-binding PucR family transcriptional regulator